MPRPAALVTGGAVRLGRAIALALAGAGYDLALHYHSSEDAAQRAAAESRDAGAQVVLLQADLSDAGQIPGLCRQATEALGGLDLLVNNAAVFFPTRTLDEAAAAWDRFMDMNLRAAFLCSVHCAGALRARRGAIVSIADIYAAFPLKGYLPYCISKAGVAMLTKSLALELGPEVRVNAVAPGAILPPPDATQDTEKRLTREIPLGRMGGAEAIAEAVVYLAGAAFVTGHILAVDGGRSINL